MIGRGSAGSRQRNDPRLGTVPERLPTALSTLSVGVRFPSRDAGVRSVPRPPRTDEPLDVGGAMGVVEAFSLRRKRHG